MAPAPVAPAAPVLVANGGNPKGAQLYVAPVLRPQVAAQAQGPMAAAPGVRGPPPGFSGATTNPPAPQLGGLLGMLARSERC